MTFSFGGNFWLVICVLYIYTQREKGKKQNHRVVEVGRSRKKICTVSEDKLVTFTKDDMKVHFCVEL